MKKLNCPRCGGKIVSSYNHHFDNHYIWCEKDYSHFHRPCTEEEAQQYPRHITKNENMFEDMYEKLHDDDCDRYPGF